MRIKIDDRHIVDHQGAEVIISLEKRMNYDQHDGTWWFIFLNVTASHYAKYSVFCVGKNGDTGFNDERVEKIAENEINYAFLNGFLDLSDYEEVT